MAYVPSDDDDLLKKVDVFIGQKPKTPTPNSKTEALRRAADKLGVDAADLGAIISFESAGSFNPHKVGGAGNKYKGLIQFGPEEQKLYYKPNDTFESQIEDGVVRYFQDRFKKAKKNTQGATLEDLYTTVIAGNPNANRDAKDAFGTSARTGTQKIAKEHRPKVLQNFFGGQDTRIDDATFWNDIRQMVDTPNESPTEDNFWQDTRALVNQPAKEPDVTIDAQIQSASDPNVKTRFGVLTTEPEQAKLFAQRGDFKPFEVNGKTLWVNTAKVYANKKLRLKNEADLKQYIAKNPNALTTLIGIAENVGDNTQGTAVQAVKDGVEQASAIVTAPHGALKQAQNYKDQFPNADISVTSTDDVVRQREEVDRLAPTSPTGEADDPDEMGRLQKRFESERRADPTLTVEKFNQILKDEEEQKFLADNANYAEFLKQTGLPNTPESQKEYNLAQQASVAGANKQNRIDVEAYNKALPRQIQGQAQIETKAPDNAPRVRVTDKIEINPNEVPEANADAYISYKVAERLAQQQGVDPSVIPDFIKAKGGTLLEGEPFSPEEIANLKNKSLNLKVNFQPGLGDDLRIFASQLKDVKDAQQTEASLTQKMKDEALASVKNPDGTLNPFDPNAWTLAFEKLITDPSNTTVNEDDLKRVVEANVEESIKQAGSATEAQRLREEGNKLSNLDKASRFAGSIAKTILKSPASFAKTIAWAEDTVDYLKSKGAIIPTLTSADLLNGIDWAISKTFGLPEKEKTKAGTLPMMYAKAVEDLFKDDPVTAQLASTKFANAIGSAVPFLVGATLSGGSTAAVAALGIGMQVGEMYDEAQRDGLSREKQLLSGALGIPIGASEVAGLNFGRLGALLNKKSGGTFGKYFLKWLLETGKEATEETIQEFLQSTAGDLVKTGMLKNGLNYQDVAKALGQSTGDAVTGGIVGALFGGGVPIAASTVGALTAPNTKARTDALLKTEPEPVKTVIEPEAPVETPKAKKTVEPKVETKVEPKVESKVAEETPVEVKEEVPAEEEAPRFKEGKREKVEKIDKQKYDTLDFEDEILPQSAQVETKPLVQDQPTEVPVEGKTEVNQSKALRELGYTLPMQKKLSEAEKQEIVDKGIRRQDAEKKKSQDAEFAKYEQNKSVIQSVSDKLFKHYTDQGYEVIRDSAQNGNTKYIELRKGDEYAKIRIADHGANTLTRNAPTVDIRIDGEEPSLDNVISQIDQKIWKPIQPPIAEGVKSAEKEPWQMTQKEAQVATKDAELPKDVLLSDSDGNFITQEKNGSYKVWKRGDTNTTLAGTISFKGEKGLEQAKQRLARVSAEVHKVEVLRAIRDGKPVPAEVLADYPDLIKQSSAPTYKVGDTVTTPNGKVKGTVESVKGDTLGVAWENAPVEGDITETTVDKVRPIGESTTENEPLTKGTKVTHLGKEWTVTAEPNGKNIMLKDDAGNGKIAKIDKVTPVDQPMRQAITEDIYEQAKDDAGRIKRGDLKTRRFDTEVERGRIAGGQRNVEASLILAADARASEKANASRGTGVDSISDTVRRQENILENYAKRNDIWFKQGHFPDRLYIDKGGEAIVYRKDENRVVKLIDPRQIDKSLTPQAFLDTRVTLFNYLFPESRYEVMGFMRDDNGKFRVIVTQPFIQGEPIKNQSDVDAFMEGRGLTRSGRQSYSNKLYEVHDLHEKNVIKGNDGTIYVLDAVPKLVNKDLYPALTVEPVEEPTVQTEATKDDALKRTPNKEDIKSFENAKTIPARQLIQDVDFNKNARVVEDGVVAVDEIREVELIRRLINEANGTRGGAFYGVFNSKKLTRKFLDTLTKKIKSANEKGIDTKQLKTLKMLVTNASKQDGTVIFAMDEEALTHEKVHRALNRYQTGTSKIAPDVQDAITNSPIFKKVSEGKWGRAYANANPANKVEEFITAASTLDWDALGIKSEADKRAAMSNVIDYYNSYAETNKGEGTAEEVLNALATEIAYVKEITNQDQKVQADEGTASEADGDSSIKDAERKEDRPDVKTEGKPDELAGKLKSREPGKSGLAFDEAEAEKAREAEMKVAAMSRAFGSEMYYVPVGMEETAATARQMIDDRGMQSIIQEALTGQPSAAGKLAVYWEMQRLSTQADMFKEDGREAEANVILNQLSDLVAALAVREQEMGREINISKWLPALSPEAAIMTAEKMVRKGFGDTSTISTDQTAKVKELAAELQKVRTQQTRSESIIAEQQRIIDNLDDEKPARVLNRQEALLENYKKKEKIIRAELAKRFPDSPVFNGEQSMLMAVGESTPKEVIIDPETASLLKDYTIGQVLTNRTYNEVIAEIQAISGASTEQAKDIHSLAMDEIRGAKEPTSEEAKKRIQIRQEHYQEADKHSHPEKQAKKAIQLAEANLKRQIDTLEKEIASGQKKVKTKNKVTSPEIERLKRERDALKSTRDELLGEGSTDEQKIARAIKSTRRSINRLTEKIQNNDTSVKTTEKLSNNELDNLKAERKTLQSILNDIRKEANKVQQSPKSQLTKIARQVAEKFPDDLELIIAADRLTGKELKSINDVINFLQTKYGFHITEAKELAQQAWREVQKIKESNKRAKDAALGIIEEERKKLDQIRVDKNNATRALNRFLSQLAANPNVIKRFNDDFRAKLVSNWGTQIFNAVQSTTVTTPAQILLDMFEAQLRSLGLNIGESSDVRARDAWRAYQYIFANNRKLAEQALAHFPEQYFEVHSGLLGDIPIDPLKLADTKKGLAKLAHRWFDANAKLNEKLTHITGAKLQEMHFRNAIVASTFDAIIRKRTDGKSNLEKAMADGTFKDIITEKDAQRAAARALEVTFASQINDPIGRELKKMYDKLDNYLPVLLNPVTYARFTYTTTKVMVLNPLTFGLTDQLLDLKNKPEDRTPYNTRDIAKGVLAWGTVVIAYGLMSALGGDDDKWYTLYPLGKDGPVWDIRRTFPLSAFFYTAHVIKESGVEGKPLPSKSEMLAGFASLETDYFQYGPVLELLGEVKDYAVTKGEKGEVKDAAIRTLGNYLAGMTRFFKPFRDTLAQFDAEERAYRDDPKTAQDKFINELSRSIPGIIRLSDQEKQYDIEGNPLEQKFPLGRIFGVNIANPALAKNKDSAATAWANELFPFVATKKMTPEERKMANARSAIREAVRAGKKVNVDDALENMKVTLSKKSLLRLKDELKYSELGAKVKYAFGDNPEKVKALKTIWKYATDQEKQEIQKVLREKKDVSRETKNLFQK